MLYKRANILQLNTQKKSIIIGNEAKIDYNILDNKLFLTTDMKNNKKNNKK